MERVTGQKKKEPRGEETARTENSAAYGARQVRQMDESGEWWPAGT